MPMANLPFPFRMKKKYSIPTVQYVYMTMPKNICDNVNPDTSNPGSIGSVSQQGSENDKGNAPARIKLYF